MFLQIYKRTLAKTLLIFFTKVVYEFWAQGTVWSQVRPRNIDKRLPVSPLGSARIQVQLFEKILKQEILNKEKNVPVQNLWSAIQLDSS